MNKHVLVVLHKGVGTIQVIFEGYVASKTELLIEADLDVDNIEVYDIFVEGVIYAWDDLGEDLEEISCFDLDDITPIGIEEGM